MTECIRPSLVNVHPSVHENVKDNLDFEHLTFYCIRMIVILQFTDLITYFTKYQAASLCFG